MQRLALSALVGVALLGIGCSSKPEAPDSGVNAVPDAATAADSGSGDDGGDDAGFDAGFDAGYVCKKDDDCAVLKQGMRCNSFDGGCIAAYSCQDDSNCQRT